LTRNLKKAYNELFFERQVVNVNALVIVPTYNEKANLPVLVPEILRQGDDIEVLIVDDNSPDGTGRLADEMSKEDRRVHVVHRAGKLGLGTAYVAGFHFGFENDFKQIITMDGDLSHNPKHIPAMRELASRCDLVIGSRYIPGGSVKNWPFRRVLLSGVANQLARNLLGLRARDCTSGFRCYRAESLNRLHVDRITSNGYSFLVEILFYFQWKDMTVGEVPIVFVNRIEGTSKISEDEVFKAVFTLARLKLFQVSRGGFPPTTGPTFLD